MAHSHKERLCEVAHSRSESSLQAGELLRWAREGAIKGEIVLEMEEIGKGQESLSASIKSGVHCLTSITKSFLNFTMSTALTTQPLAVSCKDHWHSSHVICR